MRMPALGVLSLVIWTVSAGDNAEVRELLTKLKDPANDVRRSAARQLGELGEQAKPAIPALIQATKDKDLFVRQFSAQSLGQIGPEAKEAVPALTLLLNDSRSEVQLAAAEALGKMGPAGIDALTTVVKDSSQNVQVRKKAAQGLARIGPEARKALPALTDVLTGKIASPKIRGRGKNLNDDDLRLDAAAALGSLARPTDEAAIEALKSVSEGKQPNRSLQKTARQALRKIDKQSAKTKRR